MLLIVGDMDLKSFIRDIHDFPEPGIIFRDITPLLLSPEAFRFATDCMSEPFVHSGIDYVIGAESRGFIFGTVIAQKLNAGFIPVRKPSKLPAETYSVDYDLEYGSNTLEIHKDAIEPGKRVLLVDDLIATGGTLAACCQMVNELGGELAGISVLIELKFLDGFSKLPSVQGVPTYSVLQY